MGLIIIPGEPGPIHEQPDPSAHVLSYEDLEGLVEEQLATLRGARRRTAGQAALDRAAEALHADGEVHLASAVLLVSAFRVAGVAHLANQMLMQAAVDLQLPVRARRCRVCGCTDERACRDGRGNACHWLEPDLCSHCAGREK